MYLDHSGNKHYAGGQMHTIFKNYLIKKQLQNRHYEYYGKSYEGFPVVSVLVVWVSAVPMLVV